MKDNKRKDFTKEVKFIKRQNGYDVYAEGNAYNFWNIFVRRTFSKIGTVRFNEQYQTYVYNQSLLVSNVGQETIEQVSNKLFWLNASL